MKLRHFTIGMAGHIDHGKTTLTKALTGVSTDTLKEEIKRSITIEPGFAPFSLSQNIHSSIVDVPGHEKLIRQMIAGVAGIDLVLLVIAADEGIMPQTKEHFEILSFLNIQNGIIVFTKSDQIDEELKLYLLEELEELVSGTVFAEFPALFVDSISTNGISELIKEIEKQLLTVEPRDASGPFRMPIDHVFTVKGQGTVVRGTIFEGRADVGDILVLAPGYEKVKVRQIQVHKDPKETAYAGQRAAINLAGAEREAIKRGHVLIREGSFTETQTIDIALYTPKELLHPVKQRTAIKFYSGTTETMGTLVFFDRNELDDSSNTEPVYCQVRLEQPAVIQRGDRFIIRRPSPEETIGGGSVIDPNGKKYKFGSSTSNMLKEKAEGTPQDRITRVLESKKMLNLQQIERETGLSGDELRSAIESMGNRLIASGNDYFLRSEVERTCDLFYEEVLRFHEKHPLKPGIQKASLFSIFDNYPLKLLQFSLSIMTDIKRLAFHNQYVADIHFSAHYPSRWSKRMENAVKKLEEDGLTPEPFLHYTESEQIPAELGADLKHYLLREKRAIEMNDDHLIASSAYESSLLEMKRLLTSPFTVQDAKSVTGLSRKYLIPFVELLDKERETKRNEDNTREWL
ncbi:selenocysteine-specific translation elongation factor [Fictibacillus aquaticus]|uniref:Selenocysteine-specific elongation factor n=1 Tax=Fictibacillus aquaticus TaxID=2021314 RepID=A0A235FCR6_9BACL|nr:selenocysteine-specific translation elongation factor [Fictibacillus aquaticus]OYD58747.1 selenocysteine-specific translation elongation factor [Fictibacillus aquaticus]